MRRNFIFKNKEAYLRPVFVFLVFLTKNGIERSTTYRKKIGSEQIRQIERKTRIKWIPYKIKVKYSECFLFFCKHRYERHSRVNAYLFFFFGFGYWLCSK